MEDKNLQNAEAQQPKPNPFAKILAWVKANKKLVAIIAGAVVGVAAIITAIVLIAGGSAKDNNGGTTNPPAPTPPSPSGPAGPVDDPSQEVNIIPDYVPEYA